MEKNTLFCILSIIFIVAVGCSSNDNITGKAAATELDIYEDAPAIEQQAENQTIEEITEEKQTGEQEIQIKTGEEYYDELVNDKHEESINTEEFKFSLGSIVSAQNNISLSLDGIKHEIKSEYWGKITEITFTILNNGNKAFKPKAIVILYDEKDPKEERFKPKAEINFDIEKLEIGGHAARDAIVSVSFDDIALTKKFELVVVDAADLGNKPLVVAEYDFNAFNSTLGN